MTIKTFIVALIVAITAANAFAQGGKAEPKRIKFAGLGLTATVSGTLSNGQEMDYVFSANKGQTVLIVNSRPTLFDFRVYNEAFEFETEFDSSPTLTFEIPETGDYLFFVRKKAVRPQKARFSMTLTLR
ncbi:MAG: hypothetical protein AB7J13_12530 [Pyrinomonadaceae bacterium]